MNRSLLLNIVMIKIMIFVIIPRWGREGAEGWNYETCLPYFRKAQTHQLGEDEYRSVSEDKIYHKT